VYQQFAYKADLKVHPRYLPNLSGFQGLSRKTARRLCFLHTGILAEAKVISQLNNDLIKGI